MSPERWQVQSFEMMETESLANRVSSQDDLVFSKWVDIIQGPYLSSSNDTLLTNFP